MKKICIAIGIALTFLSCGKKVEDTAYNGIPLETATIGNEAEYLVINAIIEAYYQPEAGTVIVDQETSQLSQGQTAYLKEEFERQGIAYDSTALLDYAKKNGTSNYLNDSLTRCLVQLICHQEVTCIFCDEAGWKRFYQKYPQSNGLFQFERPGISVENDKAIIQYSVARDYLAAEWYVVILEKQDGSWTVRQRILTAAA